MIPVVVAGGGLAGLSAGVFLARLGILPTVFEQRPFPGGRAYSFRDPRSGETIDNGQHLLIAGYDATMHFLDLVGTRSLLRIQDRPLIRMHHPDRGFCTLRLPALPSPAHCAAGLCTTDIVGAADRFRLFRGGLALFRSGEDLSSLSHMTVEEWLAAHGQNGETRRSFWEPLAIAVMNEHCATASAEVFVRALKRAFFADRNAAAFALPTVGLSELFAYPAVADILAHGGNVRLDCGVSEVMIDGDRATGIRLEDGSIVPSHAVILALPAHRIMSILPSRVASDPFFAPIPEITHSPIISLHLWFDREVMGNEEVLGLIGRRIQWIFNRRKISPPDGNSPNLAAGSICAVISAAHRELEFTNEQILAIGMEDLRSVFGAEVPHPVDAMVIREKRGTFSSSPDIERRRPSHITPVKGLYLAGDWTASGLPATIEGAIISGRNCAGLIEPA